ncbi:PAS domain-containing protein [Novosphingobium sp. PS1R-30]|uniref:histidine kinase n=1 Tax=Novosphingobium anseongense TaxID=3133436 RepID=A0ABU8S1U5_9SPHN
MKSNDAPGTVPSQGKPRSDRAAALAGYGILDTPQEPEFDDIVRLAADTFGAPIAVVNMVTDDRQWFKAEVGIGQRELPLDVSICAHAIALDDFLVVPDTREDSRFDRNPLVTGENGLRFYAGAILRSAHGLPIGTLCVLDRAPRPQGITPHQRLVLEVLARQVMTQLELRKALASQQAGAAQLRSEVRQRSDAEKALGEVEERLRLANRATNDAIWDWDLVTDHVIWNEALETAHGHRLEDVAPTGAWWIAQIHPRDRDRVNHSIHDAIGGTADSWTEEYRFVRADGSYANILDRGHIIRARSGEAVRMIGAMLDVTERQRTRAELAINEERLRLATEAAEVGFWDVDVVHDILIWPPLVKGMFGISPQVEVTMADFYAGLHPDDREATIQAFTAACDPDERAVYDIEYRTIGKEDGRIRWIAAKGRGLFEADGLCVRVMGTAIDVTERKRDEAILRNLNDDLERRVAQQIAEREQVEEALRQAQKMEAVGQLTGGIAHDFNNLLAGISGSLELIDRRLTQGRTDGLERYLKAAHESANRAASLTQRLLAFSRRQTLDPKPIDVNRLVHGMEDLIGRTVGPAIAVEVVGAPGLWPTRVDAAQLESALLNLAINARDAMPAGGRITIETANKWLDDRGARERDLSPGQYVSICVTDSGSGIAKEIVGRIFDPFFTTKPLGQGTGLGLSMIHGFMRQSGGQIRVYTEPGSGTTMCLYLPRHAGAIVEDAEEAKNIEAVGAGETVLVIDDEPTVRMLVVDVLEEAGYQALEAPDGAGGLKILQSDAKIDLLITDVGLPGGMNGRQVADAARQVRPDLKVLFITGFAENAAVGDGHLPRGMEVMTKPFVMAELADKITDLIER